MLDVPSAVVTVIAAVALWPPRRGIVTSHEVRLGQSVLVAWPSTRASTTPFGLNKFVPCTTTVAPGRALAGVTAARRGAPADEGGGVRFLL